MLVNLYHTDEGVQVYLLKTACHLLMEYAVVENGNLVDHYQNHPFSDSPVPISLLLSQAPVSVMMAHFHQLHTANHPSILIFEWLFPDQVDKTRADPIKADPL